MQIDEILGKNVAIYTAGKYLPHVWAVDLDEIVQVPGFPLELKKFFFVGSKDMSEQTQQLAQYTEGHNQLTQLYNRTRQLYGAGIQTITQADALSLVREIKRRNRGLASVLNLNMTPLEAYANIAMDSSSPMIFDNVLSVESKDHPTLLSQEPELYWKAHSEMMQEFAQFSLKNKYQLITLSKTGYF